MSEVSNLRKAGRLKEAWLLAAKNLAARPNDIWAARDFAWVAYDCMKRYSDERSPYYRDMDAYAISLARVRTLPLEDDEAMFFENVSKNVRFVVWELAKAGDKAIPDTEKLLNELVLWNPRSPLIIEGTVRGLLRSLKGKPEATVKLMSWVGLDGFTTDDFEKREAGDRKIWSYAEEATHRYLKALAAKDQFGRIRYEEGFVLGVIEKVKALLSDPRCEDWEWPTKSLGELLRDMGRNEEASRFLAPVILKKPNEDWAWHAFASSLKGIDDSPYAKCLFKGLALSRDKKMSLPLHEEAMKLFADEGSASLAKAEAALIDRCRQENGWPALEAATRMLFDLKDASAADEKTLKSEYVRRSHNAGSCLFQFAPRTEFYLEWVDEDKSIAGIVALEDKLVKSGWQTVRKPTLVRKRVDIQVTGISEGEIISGVLDSRERTLLAARPDHSDCPIRKHVLREAVGVFDLIVNEETSKTVCFLRLPANSTRDDDVFVHPGLASDFANLAGRIVRIQERIVFKRKKSEEGGDQRSEGEWDWKANSITPIDGHEASEIEHSSLVQFYVERAINDQGLLSIATLKAQIAARNSYVNASRYGFRRPQRTSKTLESAKLNCRYASETPEEHHVYQGAVFGKTRFVLIGTAQEMSSGELYETTVIPEVSGIYDMSNGWGHIGCTENVSVPPKIAQGYSIEPGSTVTARLYKAFVRNKTERDNSHLPQTEQNGRWEWRAENIEVISPPEELEVTGSISIAVGGFGFLSTQDGLSCFVPASVIQDFRLVNGDSITARIRKSWNRKKKESSWAVTAILSIHEFTHTSTDDSPATSEDTSDLYSPLASE